MQKIFLEDKTDNLLDILVGLRKNNYFKQDIYLKTIIEKILDLIIPINPHYQVKININNSNRPAFFTPTEKSINVSPDALRKFISNKIIKKIGIKPNDVYEYFIYYLLFSLIHETNHINQFLIGKKYIDFPYKIIIDAYKNLFELNIDKIDKQKKIKKVLKHWGKYADKPTLLIERNANVETYSLLLKLANKEHNDIMTKHFYKYLKTYLTFGYKGFYNGSVEETYSKCLLDNIYHSFKKDENIPIEDKVRYGLPVDNETIEKVLKKEFKI